ncbi:MAG: transposase, partial [uncultured bacterium]
MIALRTIPLSSRPGKIKESITGFLTIKHLFEGLQNVLKILPLSPSSLKYYAIWVQKAKMTQLVKITNPYKRYLYLIAFIAHQYYCRQDLLADTLLQSVQSALNTIDKKQHEEYQNTKKEKDHATKVLSSSYRDKADLLTKIQTVINTKNLSAKEKVEQIKKLINKEGGVNPIVAACIEKLDQQITNALNDADFYNVLEKQSIPLQNRLSSIVKYLEFNVLKSKLSLLDAITYFKNSEGLIGNKPPCDFLDAQSRKHLFDDKGKLRISLYKALLFVKTAAAIKSGEMNLTYSYRYLSIDEYLINKDVWKLDRNNYLVRSNLTNYNSVKKTMSFLKKELDVQYQKVNENIINGSNQYITFNKAGEVIVDTPKVEKIETLRIAELIKQKNYISILDVLGNIDQITNFSECLQHYSVVQKIKRPANVLFYAGL